MRGVGPEAVVLNEFLKNMRVRIYEEELKLVKHGFAVTATLLRDSLMNKVELVKEETILGIFKKHNELQYQQIGIGVSKGTYANSKQGLDYHVACCPSPMLVRSTRTIHVVYHVPVCVAPPKRCIFLLAEEFCAIYPCRH